MVEVQNDETAHSLLAHREQCWRRLLGPLAAVDTNHAHAPQCRVIYVSTAVEVDWWAHRFLADPHLPVVGFDIEWRVTFKTGKCTAVLRGGA